MNSNLKQFKYMFITLFLILFLSSYVYGQSVCRTDVFIGGSDGYHTYRIPAVIVTPKGTVLVFCEGRKNGKEDFGDIDLLLKRSEDGGKT